MSMNCPPWASAPLIEAFRFQSDAEGWTASARNPGAGMIPYLIETFVFSLYRGVFAANARLRLAVPLTNYCVLDFYLSNECFLL